MENVSERVPARVVGGSQRPASRHDFGRRIALWEADVSRAARIVARGVYWLSRLMISLKHRFLYLHIPKTAGNAVQNLLREYSEDKVVCLTPCQDGIERFEVRNDRFNIQKHSTLGEYRRELGAATLAPLFKFCCVRNPWERAVSFYFSPHRGVTAWDRHAFLQLLDQMLPVRAFLETPDDAGASPFENVDFVMRYERLDEDFRTVTRRLHLPDQPLPIRNKSIREHFSRYYDAELIEAVGQKFADEIAFFGYRCDRCLQA